MKLALASLALFTLVPSGLSRQSLQDMEPQGLHDLFGQVLTAAEQVGLGNELWRADRTGASLVADLNAGPQHGFHNGDPSTGWGAPLKGIAWGADFYTLAYLAGGKIGLTRTDGTPGGTSVLYEFVKSGSPTYPIGYSFDGVGLVDQVVFSARRDGVSWGIWATDGTSAGTHLIGAAPDAVFGFTRLGNQALFFTKDSKYHLWRTDGTAASTVPIHTFPTGSSIEWDSLTVVGDMAIFAADDGVTGTEIWRTDATVAGTSLVLDVLAGAQGSDPEDLVAAGDGVYFSAEDGSGGRDLWRTDGTAAGTALVASIQWGFDHGPRQLTALGELLFFSHAVSGPKDYLYVHDHGAGTLDQLAEFKASGSQSAGIREMAAIGSRRVFFQGIDGLRGAELWASDGTSSGTQLFEDIQPGLGWGQPQEPMLSGGQLFFVATEAGASEALHNRDVGATAQPLGIGCSASGRLPHLTADDPLLGGASEVRIVGAEPSAAVLLFSGPGVAPIGLGSGCHVQLDLAAVSLVVSGATDAGGAWTSAPLSIPSDPALDGAQISLQAVVGPTGTQPLGFDLSSAVLMTLGT